MIELLSSKIEQHDSLIIHASRGQSLPRARIGVSVESQASWQIAGCMTMSELNGPKIGLGIPRDRDPFTFIFFQQKCN
jgi:hypothetical protein